MTTAEAAEYVGKSTDALNAWLGKHGVRRYVRREDLDFALAATGAPGVHASTCVVKGKPHLWNRGTRTTDEPTGLPMIWCGRKGCGVGVVLREGASPIYRHRLA